MMRVVHCSLLIAALALAGCGLRKSAPLDPPIITSASLQHTLYNGARQPIDARTAKDDAPELRVTYFPSEDALERDEGGFTEAPVEVGTYYARIDRPAGNGYRAGRSITVEYVIQAPLGAGD
jgi:hypothetical protein